MWILNWCNKIIFSLHSIGNTNCFWLFWKLRTRKFIGAENFSHFQFKNFSVVSTCYYCRSWLPPEQRQDKGVLCWWLLPLPGTVVLWGPVLPMYIPMILPLLLSSPPTGTLFWRLSSAVRDSNLLRGIGYLGCFVFQACPYDSRLYPDQLAMESGIQLQGNALSALFPLLSATAMRSKD